MWFKIPKEFIGNMADIICNFSKVRFIGNMRFQIVQKSLKCELI